MVAVKNSVIEARGFSSVSQRWYFIGLALILVAAVFLRTHGLDRSLWIDEAGSLYQAKAENFTEAMRQDVHPPLYYAVLRTGLRITDSIPLLRGFSVICGLGLVGFGVLLGGPSQLGKFLGAAIFALLPALLSHSQELRPYALLYLLFIAALFIVVRRVEGQPVARDGALLAAVLLLAAATHQLTAFFLVSLVPLLVWPVRREGLRSILARLWPLAPAAGLVIGFNLLFIQRPDTLAGGWWVPAVTWDYAGQITREATGWVEFHRLAEALGRHLPWGTGVTAITVGTAALAMFGFFFAAWRQSRPDTIEGLLLLTAVIYLLALLAYSEVRESLLLSRTVLPALFPFSMAMVRALGRQPRAGLRWIGAGGLSAYLIAASGWYGLQAKLPREDLQGLTAAVREHHRSGDLLVLFGGLSFGLNPYWPEIAASRPLVINPAAPVPATIASLRERLDQLHGQQVQLVYRLDFYLNLERGAFPEVMAELNQRGLKADEIWRKDGYVFLEAKSPAISP